MRAAAPAVAISVLPAQLGRAEAESRVLAHLPGWRCVSARLLHHPYAGFVFGIEQRAAGRRLRGEMHVLVDLRSGATATSDPWPAPVAAGDVRPDGPEPVVDPGDARHSARQCVVRTVLHRRLSLRQPRIDLLTSLVPLYKPNWLLSLRADRSPEPVTILVDALTGGYHVV